MHRSRRSRLLVYLVPTGMIFLCGASEGVSADVGRKERALHEKLRDGPGDTNHPVHVVPSANVSVPAAWPLEAGGAIGCITCHDSLPPLNGSENPYLREFDAEQTDRREFCMKCHTEAAHRTAAGAHWMAVDAAHPTHDTDSDQDSQGGLDAASARCLSCHDGVNAREAKTSIGGMGSFSSFGDRGRNHPIGMKYRVGTRGNSAALKPAALLPASVRLPEGKVSCVSCHSLYESSPNRLSVPIEGSRLCFTCHQMD